MQVPHRSDAASRQRREAAWTGPRSALRIRSAYPPSWYSKTAVGIHLTEMSTD
jgi:hypothetical protein